MRPWRGGGRSGRGIAVLSAGPGHFRIRSARAAAARLPGRRGGTDRQYRPARAGAHRIADGADFAILSRTVYGKPLVYLDSGASAQKPKAVLDAMRDFAQSEYANVHRG